METSKEEKVIYYSDELNDDFAEEQINAINVTGDYKYIHKNIFWNIAAAISYGVMVPIAYLYCKIVFNFKCENKEVLKKYKGQGYFVYANHTQKVLDAFMPAIISFPKKAYEIVNPDNVSIPVQGNFNKMLGAMPLANTVSGSINLIKAIKYRVNSGNPIFIYPEAHIWPYYTKIRNYPSTSFKYPIKLDMPVFCITNTYQKRKFSKKPKIVAYLDGPFYADDELKGKEKEEDLRNRVYDRMNERSKANTVNYIKYIKK